VWALHSEGHPFLGASPDGLVGDNVVLEVKCPYSSRNHKITSVTVPYLEDFNGTLRLKKKHQYFYQVMGQLLATNRNECHFVVYTYVDIVVIEIARDEDFINEMVSNLSVFFNKHFLPCLKEKYMYKYFC
jgi:YqaJ-like viral recombinase domain